MTRPKGFTYTIRKSGDVVISHLGRQATVLRNDRARWLLDRIVSEDDQELMARVTGNYKRGNEH